MSEATEIASMGITTMIELMQARDEIKRLKEALAKQEHGEPVAWMDVDGNVSDNNDHKCFPIPLYTTPPQRKPLTDEEIVAINDKHYIIDYRDFDADIAIARAIEAAHGIKE